MIRRFWDLCRLSTRPNLIPSLWIASDLSVPLPAPSLGYSLPCKKPQRLIPVSFFPCSHDRTCRAPDVKKRKSCFLIAQNYLLWWTNNEESAIRSLGRVVPPKWTDGQIWVYEELLVTWSLLPCVALMVAIQTDPLGDKDKRCHWRSQC